MQSSGTTKNFSAPPAKPAPIEYKLRIHASPRKKWGEGHESVVETFASIDVVIVQQPKGGDKHPRDVPDFKFVPQAHSSATGFRSGQFWKFGLEIPKTSLKRPSPVMPSTCSCTNATNSNFRRYFNSVSRHEFLSEQFCERLYPP